MQSPFTPVNMHTKKQSEGTLMLRTRKLLQQSDVHKLSLDTGIPYYWIRRFASGSIANPSVNRVQALFEHLTKKQLCQ